MKKSMMMAVLITALFTGISLESFSQEISKMDYLEKSKQQKTAGWILLGGGAALAVVGSTVMYENFCIFCSNTMENSFNAGTALAVIGSAAMIASVPMFISSRNNAEKAAFIAFKNQPLDIPRYSGKIPRSYPAISLSIPLN